jgi:thiamine-phosphate pyrophosphorylase
MGEKPGDMLRIVDASLNRIGEGLRFLEDVARLMLNDAVVTRRLKNMRHEMVRCDPQLQTRLLRARDAEGDVGRAMEVPGEENQREMPAAVAANARRAQESLRVMEEMAKVPGLGLDPENFKRARFELYAVEKTLLSGILRQEKIRRLRGLYVIIDIPALGGRSPAEVAGQAIRGGAKVIQLRDKAHSRGELLPIAQELKNLCAAQDCLFIMNDYLDIALAVEADGLHVGQDDLPVTVARRLLPADKVLGCSARTVARATLAQSEGADYIAVGAMYPTASKETAAVVGPERLREIRQAVALPLVAIGGINKDNLGKVIAAGAVSVAVISAVLGADDAEEASRRIAERIEDEQLE